METMRHAEGRPQAKRVFGFGSETRGRVQSQDPSFCVLFSSLATSTEHNCLLIPRADSGNKFAAYQPIESPLLGAPAVERRNDDAIRYDAYTGWSRRKSGGVPRLLPSERGREEQTLAFDLT